MKKNALVITLIASLLGNLTTLVFVCWTYGVIKKLSPSGKTGGNAVVLEVITSEVDGYTDSHIIANYNGKKIILSNAGILVPGNPHAPPSVGDSIVVSERKMNLGVMKMLSYDIAY